MDAALADTAYRKSDTGAREPVPGALSDATIVEDWVDRDPISGRCVCRVSIVLSGFWIDGYTTALQAEREPRQHATMRSNAMSDHGCFSGLVIEDLRSI